MTSTAPIAVDEIVEQRLAGLARYIDGPEARRLPRHLLGSITRSSYVALVPDVRRTLVRARLTAIVEAAAAEVAANRPGGQS